MALSAARLKQGLKNCEFIPFYQPIVNQNNEIVGAEIIARWLYPKYGPIDSRYLIENIEKKGLSESFIRIIMNNVYSDILRYQQIKDIPFFMSYNVSPCLMMRGKFRKYIIVLSKKLQEAGISPVFELTERENIWDYPDATNIFDNLVRSGLKFAIADYGACYASKSLTSMMQPTFIKIDRQFTVDKNCPISARFVKSVVILARMIDAKVIAEGVDTLAQFDYLKILGVDYLQGRYCGAPEPLERLLDQLNRQQLILNCH